MMTLLFMTGLANAALLVPTACLHQQAYDTTKYTRKLEKAKAQAEEFRQHVAEARSARVKAFTMVGERRQKSFPMPAEEFERVQKILAHTQAVPPAMGKWDGVSGSFYGGITLEFLNAEGTVIERLNFPTQRFMPETAAQQLSPARSMNFYEAPWSLPDAECAEFKALPVFKKAWDWIDQAVR